MTPTSPPPIMTAQELATMDRDGFVTIDTPFTPAEVSAAAAAVDRAFGPGRDGFLGSDIVEPEVLHLMFHPFVEAVAKQMLRADDVALRAAAARKTAPKEGAQPALEGEHADIRYSAADLDSTPRAILCTILFWLTDVTPTRAPLMYRAGSHRQLALAFGDQPASVAGHPLKDLPKIAYAQPAPLLARAGQISVGSTGVIHSGSINTDTTDRKVIFTQFQARGVVPVKFPEAMQAGFDRYMAAIRPLVDPSRHRLLWN
ncbi:MAG: phytanoyl-CoA dioxygenase family protein [Planctomycetota bacterium]|nr:phytanoyl-CoA dioxygenase family protein [Planctomycetota bacterium]